MIGTEIQCVNFVNPAFLFFATEGSVVNKIDLQVLYLSSWPVTVMLFACKAKHGRLISVFASHHVNHLAMRTR